MDTIIQDRYLEWQQNNAVDNLDENEKIDCFYRELEFGTGGLRGKIGQGTNRMNFYTVGRATFGLAEYLLANYCSPSIAIAYDSRKFSKEFATLVAEIMSSKGVQVYIFSELMPTPVLSFAVRSLKTSAGVVITASHNPKAYNGYKVYNEKGCQITDEVAKEITNNINKFGYFNSYNKNESLIKYLDSATLKEFIKEVYKFSVYEIDKAYEPKVVYTPLCGTGRVPARLLFDKMGLSKVHVVKEQEMPDENFTTCPYPNPEEDEAMALAYRDAKEQSAELILATDPDADRVGVAERDENGNITRFTGNEVGFLLLDFVIKQKIKNGEDVKGKSIIKTIVTSDVGEKIAKKYSVNIVNVLTGFKYIGEQIDLLKTESDYIFGLEESCGYLAGTYARDKDSIGALMLVLQAKAYYKKQNKTLKEALNDIYEEYGYSATHLQSILFEGQDGAVKKDNIINAIRENPIKEICGKNIETFIDYKKGINGLPKSNVMEFSGNDFKFIIRPSGTEPKLKIYYFANGKTKEMAEQFLNKIVSEVSSLLK